MGYDSGITLGSRTVQTLARGCFTRAALTIRLSLTLDNKLLEPIGRIYSTVMVEVRGRDGNCRLELAQGRM